MHSRQLLDRVHDVVLADHHALRRAGRAARVDQRGDVVRVGRRRRARARSALPCAISSLAGRHAVGQAVAGRVDHVDLLAAAGSSSRTLRSRSRKPASSTIATSAPAWLARYWISSGRRRVVDADRRRPQELGGQVEPVEVGAVAHHQQHPVAGRRRRRAAGRPRPGRRPPSTSPTVHDVPAAARRFIECNSGNVGSAADQLEEPSRHGAADDDGVDLGDRRTGGHPAIVPSWHAWHHVPSGPATVRRLNRCSGLGSSRAAMQTRSTARAACGPSPRGSRHDAPQ